MDSACGRLPNLWLYIWTSEKVVSMVVWTSEKVVSMVVWTSEKVVSMVEMD